MKLAALIFDDITLLDLIGPLEVLKRLPELKSLQFVAAQQKAAPTSIPGIDLSPTITLSELDAADIFLIPGGFGVRSLLKNEKLLENIRRIHATTTWTVSICTGSLLLAAAGLLNNLKATTHWNSQKTLESFGTKYTSQRVIEQGKIITSAGVSSGIDMALLLAAKISGEEVAKAIQLSIEYDPQPPFDAGSPQKAGEKITNLVRQMQERAIEAAKN